MDNDICCSLYLVFDLSKVKIPKNYHIIES